MLSEKQHRFKSEYQKHFIYSSSYFASLHHKKAAMEYLFSASHDGKFAPLETIINCLSISGFIFLKCMRSKAKK